MKKIVGIIPARGNSKGILRKNILLLAGKELITYTIEAALKSKYLEKIFVSTEDKEIERISKRYKEIEIIKRPKKLSLDKVGITDVILHAISYLEDNNYIPDLVVALQPTSPLRSSEDIDKAIELFFRKKPYSLVSLCKVEHTPYWFFKIKKYLNPLFGKKYLRKVRQNVDEIYQPNGAIYISTPYVLRKYKSFYTKRTIPYIMPLERSIDIDTEIDFKLAELILNR